MDEGKIITSGLTWDDAPMPRWDGKEWGPYLCPKCLSRLKIWEIHEEDPYIEVWGENCKTCGYTAQDTHWIDVPAEVARELGMISIGTPEGAAYDAFEFPAP